MRIRLGFVKRIYLFCLGFVGIDNDFLCISKKMSTFADPHRVGT